MFLVHEGGEISYNQDAKISAILALVARVSGIRSEKRLEAILKNISGGAIDASGAMNALRNLTKPVAIKAGFTDVQADRVIAAISLGQQISAISDRMTVDEPDAAVAVLQAAIGSQSREHACVLVLDVKNKILATEIISIGTPTEALFSPAEVFKTVLRHGGNRAILGHNHPSGSRAPSDQDVQLTKAMVTSGRLLDLEILDHIIVTPNGGQYTSLRQIRSDLWL